MKCEKCGKDMQVEVPVSGIIKVKDETFRLRHNTMGYTLCMFCVAHAWAVRLPSALLKRLAEWKEGVESMKQNGTKEIDHYP